MNQTNITDTVESIVFAGSSTSYAVASVSNTLETINTRYEPEYALNNVQREPTSNTIYLMYHLKSYNLFLQLLDNISDQQIIEEEK